jgi:DNA repair exonuclease SbcCD ATPase subunit
MRLLSATVRNYRVHREVTVNFDDSRTLIGGANEAGKSTFIEAVHRALFLKATVTGDAKASMESLYWPGHPEVEVRFQARGREYQLVKRFAGQNGTTRLTMVGGATWQGDEAQARLAELLGVSDVGGGRGILERVSQQWAHLWVWQGEGGGDPAAQLAAQQACLLQQLQESGGAVAMQSALDGRVAARFSQLRRDLFTQGGVARRGSELERAQAQVGQLDTAAVAARERVIELRSAAEEYEQAGATIAAASTALESLSLQLRQVEEDIEKLEKLRRDEETHSRAVDTARERVALLEKVEEDIARLNGAVNGLQQSLGPAEATLTETEERYGDSRRQSEDADQRYDWLIARTREARLRKELAEACVDLFQKNSRLQELQTRLTHVSGLQAKLKDTHSELARFAPLEEEEFKKLQDLEVAIGQARAALGGMATEVEVINAEEPVRLGDDLICRGDRRTITDPTILQAGSAQLRVFPGGGDSLSQARERLRLLTEELQATLDRKGLASTEQAAEVFIQRKGLVAEADTIRAALQEWDPEGLIEEVQKADQAVQAASANVQRRADQMAEERRPLTLYEAKEWLEEAENGLQSAELAEEQAGQMRDDLRERCRVLEGELAAKQAQIADDRHRLVESRAQLNLLVANHGTEGLRRRALEEACRIRDEAEIHLATTKEAIAVLQPDLLEADCDRLQRALREMEAQKQTAMTKRAVSHEKLRSEGTADPVADLSLAEARLVSARESLVKVERRASAIALVDDMFREEQQALADRFSQPLAEKISDYLQTLFGPGAKAAVVFRDNCFQSIKLTRPADDGAIEFSALSGGTREQVAAAVRLAMAELLAAEHDGSLPIVFDDSFAYSDPERVQTLQRMLDLASRRGLQVIVLTCNPADYAALGAHQRMLRTDHAAGH